jgi:hypothetical protein
VAARAARRPALRGAPPLIAGGLVLWTSFARAHEPFQITTEARVLGDGLALHVTMASRTVTLACPGVVGAPRSLAATDLEQHRLPLEACAKGLYAVTSRGRTLAPNGALVSLTQEGDFDARLRYPPAEPGPLVFDAVHLVRIADAMYGAELTVTGERVFLGQALLRASARTLSVNVPTAGAEPASAPRVPSFGACLRSGIERAPRWIAAAIAFFSCLWLGKRLLT